MRFIICYDISDNRRRERIATALLDFGCRIQESVFVATLDAELKDRMFVRLGKLMSEAEDSIFVFALCGACEEKLQVLGIGCFPRDKPFYVL